MVVERPQFGGDQMPKNVDYFLKMLKNGERNFQYVLLSDDF